MKKRPIISISIPCYNEENNVQPLAKEIVKIFHTELTNYDYQIQFIDNASTDSTREKIVELCDSDSNIRAIFNARNFPLGSAFYGMTQTTGDCTIYMAADFQDPVYLIPEFVKKWEEGYIIVGATKTSSKENRILYLIRSFYYKMIYSLASKENNYYIQQFTGFALYDKKFMDFIKNLKDPMPFLRGFVAEYGYKIYMFSFDQPLRKSGVSKGSFYSLYSLAMRSITCHTKLLLRLPTFIGAFGSGVTFLTILVYSLLSIIKVNWFSFHTILDLILIFLLFILFGFLGLLGEYILNINFRIMNRPLVIEEKRINFQESNIGHKSQI